MKKTKLFALFIAIHLFHSGVSQESQFKALLITTTRGWHHEALHDGVIALRQMAEKNQFQLVLMEDPGSFTESNLKQYAVVIFLHTTGNIFDSSQQSVMERFIRSGKGFVGIHSASDTEYDWEWYTKLVGRMFTIHPTVQTARLQVLDSSFNGLQGFAGGRLWADEYYEFGPEKTKGLNYILGVDESSYNAKVQWGSRKGEGMGKLHPLAWYHHFDGGRSFYSALGHVPATFSDPAFLQHIYAGIYWAATGRK